MEQATARTQTAWTESPRTMSGRWRYDFELGMDVTSGDLNSGRALEYATAVSYGTINMQMDRRNFASTNLRTSTISTARILVGGFIIHRSHLFDSV
mmetsp:Transcript_78373/g.210845  ORF Transcript_78373/g.210845 Transcript_78373/m.210845 type:complete len:96 (-) Transcript_78373:312-599(-)